MGLVCDRVGDPDQARAKKLTKQLNASGVPAVELPGNLSQNARTRTMDRFR